MHPPFDKRVFGKEAVSLAEAGFEVIHLAPGDERCNRRHGVQVITYRPPQGLLDRALQLPRLYRLAERVDADCYHCNEVDSWFVGAALKLFRRKQVVFDVHEHYPSTFLAGRTSARLRPLVAGLVQFAFRLLTPLTDRIVLAKRTVADDFAHDEAEKLVLVLNYSPRPTETTGPSSASPTDEAVTAIHLGLISRVRGWLQLLDALKQARLSHLRLHIIGEFNDGSLADFQAQVQAYGLEDRVLVEDWMPYDEAFARLLAADIGLLLLQPGRLNHVYAFPHKVFDYMAAGLPVVVPKFAVEIAPLVQEANCGLLVDPADSVDIARTLDELASNPDVRRRMGQNGREAILTRYNWENEAAKLIAMYRELEKGLS